MPPSTRRRDDLGRFAGVIGSGRTNAMSVVEAAAVRSISLAVGILGQFLVLLQFSFTGISILWSLPTQSSTTWPRASSLFMQTVILGWVLALATLANYVDCSIHNGGEITARNGLLHACCGAY